MNANRSRTIAADTARVKGPRSTMPQFCVGSGRAHEGLLAEHQRHLRLVQDAIGFRYLRFHGLLHDDMAVYTEDSEGRPVHNWMYVDLLFDELLRVGIRPFVEFGFMPSALASGTTTVFWWKGNVTLPKSQTRWNDLIAALVTHWIDRYGLDEVRRWYFEVWNEPNLRGFFDADQADYFRFYAATARSVKAVDAQLRVGGPATAEVEWIDEFLAFCAAEAVPVDFVSTHYYGVEGAFDEFGVQKTRLKPDDDALSAQVRGVHRQVKASAFPDLEIHFTEWSASYSPADPVHDAYPSAAWVLGRLKRCEGYADSMSYWTFTDLFEEPGPPRKPFHGGFGLVNLQGIPKPTWFAYRYLADLGPTELAHDDPDAWVCTDPSGAVQALVWDRTPTGLTEDNQSWYTRDLPAAPVAPVTLNLAGLNPGPWTLEVRRTGYRQNDVYTASLGLRFDGSPSPAQVQTLLEAVADRPTRRTVEVDPSGRLVVDLGLSENEVVFCRLTRGFDALSK